MIRIYEPANGVNFDLATLSSVPQSMYSWLSTSHLRHRHHLMCDVTSWVWPGAGARMVHTALPRPHGHREQPVGGGDQDQRPPVDQREVPHREEDGHIPGIIRDTGDKLSVATH